MMTQRVYNLLDDVFLNDWMNHSVPEQRKNPQRPAGHHLMRTDISENDSEYRLDMELPGYKKEDITARLEHGYLYVVAETHADNQEENEQKNRYLRRERYTGMVSRTFYVGEEIKQDDIKARFDNGVLSLTLLKKKPEEIEEKKFIAIE